MPWISTVSCCCCKGSESSVMSWGTHSSKVIYSSVENKLWVGQWKIVFLRLRKQGSSDVQFASRQLGNGNFKFKKWEKISVKQKIVLTLEGICFCWYSSESDQAHIVNASWTNTSPCLIQRHTYRTLQHKNHIDKCRLHEQSSNLSLEHWAVYRIPYGYSIHIYSTWEQKRRYSLIRLKFYWGSC